MTDGKDTAGDVPICPRPVKIIARRPAPYGGVHAPAHGPTGHASRPHHDSTEPAPRPHHGRTTSPQRPDNDLTTTGRRPRDHRSRPTAHPHARIRAAARANPVTQPATQPHHVATTAAPRRHDGRTTTGPQPDARPRNHRSRPTSHTPARIRAAARANPVT
ncbi:polyphosphate kinase 2 family protein [Streptomyces malaysiensis subsp. malaysiensis]|nr:polyphosphate kinase 2 family protein [Streptomyces malaysiensis]